ncbi:MAG: hypothetical protein HXX10_24740 [Rhodoplanes sp.]|uniref:hypothetical protein n=1 Tax=Rhodoplanes sp. TaxID=1968906 RepID=UPI0017E325D1|nr:hypothetical protein [Rhodoplanes sp.]NVO17247.1 hypothetical protein [Rhodoplanes sp.]
MSVPCGRVSAVARLDGGRVHPSTRTLENYAAATGHRLVIDLVPVTGKAGQKRA